MYLLSLVRYCFVWDVNRVLEAHRGTITLVYYVHHGFINIQNQQVLSIATVFVIPVRNTHCWELPINSLVLFQHVQIHDSIQNLVVVLVGQVLLVVEGLVLWNWWTDFGIICAS